MLLGAQIGSQTRVCSPGNMQRSARYAACSQCFSKLRRPCDREDGQFRVSLVSCWAQEQGVRMRRKQWAQLGIYSATRGVKGKAAPRNMHQCRRVHRWYTLWIMLPECHCTFIFSFLAKAHSATTAIGQNKAGNSRELERVRWWGSMQALIGQKAARTCAAASATRLSRGQA